jgi:hypothetical protein
VYAVSEITKGVDSELLQAKRMFPYGYPAPLFGEFLRVSFRRALARGLQRKVSRSTNEKAPDAPNKTLASPLRGELRIDTERVALADIEDAWRRDQRGHRLAIIP